MGSFRFRRGACPALALILISILSGGIARAGIVGKEPVNPLRLARSIEPLPAEIGKGLSGADGRLFAVSARSFLEELYLPLVRNGSLRELSVLLPAENVMAEEDLAGIRSSLERAGVTEADRDSFRLENGTIRGLMAGVPVHLFPLTGIPARGGPGELLLLDPGFLHMIYKNEVRTPIVELAWKLIVTLRNHNVRAVDAVVLDLPPVDDVSMRYGFLPVLLEEMISSPATFKETFPEKWNLLQQAETAFYFAQYPESMLLYRKYLDGNPGDASACYKVAVMAVRDLDADMALQWLNRAAAADPRYARAYAEAADYLVQKELLDPAERVLRGGVAAFPKDPRMATSLAGFFILRGQRIGESGDPAGAAAYFAMAAQVEGADPAVRERASRLMKGEGGVPPQVPR